MQLSPASDWVPPPRLLQLLSLLRPSRLQLGGEGVVDTDLRIMAVTLSDDDQ